MRIDGKRASEFSTEQLRLMVGITVTPEGEYMQPGQIGEAKKVIKLREAKKEVK